MKTIATAKKQNPHRLTALGGTAISQGITLVQDAGTAAFRELAHPSLTGIASFIGIVLVNVFFVTPSDSGSLVIDTISAGNKVNAPMLQRVFWVTFKGLFAIALLGGGLMALVLLQAYVALVAQ